MGFNVTPSSTAQPSNRNYVSAQSLSYAQSIDKFNLESKLVRPFGSQDISGFATSLGHSKGIKGDTFHHVSEDYIREIIKGTATAGAAGATVVFTMDAGYDFTTNENANAPYIATGSLTTFTLRDHDILMLAGGVLAAVSGISGNTCNLTPLVSTENIPTIIVSEEIPIVGSLDPEGSTSKETTNKRLNEYTNNLSRIKRTSTLTGDMLGQATWFDNLGKNANQFAWYHENLRDTYRNIMNDKEMLNLVGNKITNTTLADIAGFETVMGSEGLFPWAEANANLTTYTVGSWAMSDLDSTIDDLDKYEGCDENTFWMGHKLFMEFDEVVGTGTQAINGGVIYDNMSKDHAMAFEFSTVSKGGYGFHKRKLDMLNKPWGLGAAGLKYNSYGIVIPTDNIIQPQFGGTRESVPAIRNVYSDRSDMTDGFREWVHGGAGDNPTSGTDEMKVEFLCTTAMEFFGGNRFSLMKAV